jgi:hypothetical protein
MAYSKAIAIAVAKLKRMLLRIIFIHLICLKVCLIVGKVQPPAGAMELSPRSDVSSTQKIPSF